MYMTIEELIEQHPDLYIRVLNIGAGYGMQGFSHFDTLADITDAEIQLQLMYDDMMKDQQDLDSIDKDYWNGGIQKEEQNS